MCKSMGRHGLKRLGTILTLTGAAAGLLGLAGRVSAQAPSKADVEFGLLSQKDPHPLTYSWGAEIKPVTDPGAFFYYFYYTGTVGPDARVEQGTKIQRIPVPYLEWEAEKKNIIAKLAYFYQVTKNIQPGGLSALGGEGVEFGGAGNVQAPIPGAPSALVGAEPGVNPGVNPGGENLNPDAQPAAGFPAPGIDGGAGAVAPVPAADAVPGGFPAPAAANPNGEFNPGAPAEPNAAATEGAGPLPPGGGGPNQFTQGYAGYSVNMPGSGFGGSNLNPNAAAEWTFYLDQFVLWQYYCARNLLQDQNDEIIDPQGSAASGAPSVLSTAGQDAMSQQLGALAPGGGAGGTGSSATKGKATANSGPLRGPNARGLPANKTAGNAPGGGGGAGVGSFIDSNSGDFYAQRGAGSGELGGAGGPGGPGLDSQTLSAMREIFDLTVMKQTGIDWRDKFIDTSKANEQKIYKAFIEMINRIDERQVNQEQYDQWIENKRQQIFNFAENWRKLDQGEAQVINDTMFLITKEPLESVPYDAINIVKNEQVTPQDLINADGTIKKPVLR